MLALFTFAIGVAATLLFVVQPMVGKMILPRGGGSPQVWISALVFFQAALLAGYAYAHYSVRWLGPRRQILLHAAVLALPLLVLPIALPDIPRPSGWGQSAWILGLLTLGVGGPFLVLAAASPLLQAWLASTRHEAARDPYFLYAASNTGSLVGLLSYPFLVEPLLPLSTQARAWAGGYVLFVLLALACGFVALRRMGRDGAGAGGVDPGGTPDPAGPLPGSVPGAATGTEKNTDPTRVDRTFWVLAAAIPSALLMGVTHYLTSRIAPVPLLWVLPLAVYLVTFIVAFSRRQIGSRAMTSRWLAILAVIVALTLMARIEDPVWLMILLHLGLLGAGAFLCHLRLVERRPTPSHLTEFYLLVSLGGVLGGIFSALVAPVVFDYIAEYPIAVVLATLFRSPWGEGASSGTAARGWRPRDLLLPGALVAYLLVAEHFLVAREAVPDGLVMIALAVLPALAVFLLSARPLRFTLALGILFVFAQSGQMYRGDVLHEERTFFGVYRIARDPGDSFNILYHGATVHGLQRLGPEHAGEPLAYYHRSGPAGRVMAALATRPDKRKIALVGAGTGALAALAAPHQHVTLFEIDPAVIEIAENPRYFTYLAQTRASYETRIADGRIGLREADESWDLIVLDAFTSGSIPIHLITREAVQLYLDRLEPGGALLFHVSNSHLELAPVLASHARDLDLVAFESIDVRGETEEGILGSHWVLLVRSPEDLEGLSAAGWQPLRATADAPTWTDDFSNLLTVQRWF